MAGINVPIIVQAKNAKSEIRDFNKELRTVDQTYKILSEEMDTNGDKLGKLTVKQKALAEQLKIQENITAKTKDGYNAQNKVLAEYKTKSEQAAKALDESRQKAEASREKLEKLGDILDVMNKRYEANRISVIQSNEALESAKSTVGTSAEQIKKLEAALESANKKFSTSQTEVQRTEKLIESANKQYSKNEESVTKQEAALERANKQYERNGQILSQWERDLQRSEAAAQLLRSSINETTEELKIHSGSIQQASQKIQEFSANYNKGVESVQGVTDKLKGAGTVLTASVTAPILAIGTAAAKSAIDFETAFTGVRKKVDATEAEFASLERGIRDMAGQMPISATEIASVAEAAGQLGINKENILDFTRVMSDMGVATSMSATEAAVSLARFANITKMSQGDFDRLGSTISFLGSNFATTESEIAEMGLRLAGAGAQIGLKESEILGISAALSSLGVEAQAGGSAFSKVFVAMQLAVETGRDSLEDFAHVAGMSATQFSNLFRNDSAEAITSFIVGLSRMNEEGISAIKTLDEMGLTEVRLRDALLRTSNASELFSSSLDMANKAWTENTALANEANKRYETTESQLLVLKNQLVDVAIELGEAFLPTIKSASDAIGNFVGRFGEMDESTRSTVITIGLIAAALGPLLVTVGKGIEIFTGLKTAMSLMSIQASLAATTTTAAGASAKGAAAGFAMLNAALGPVGLALAALSIAIGVGTVAWSSYKKSQEDARQELLNIGKELKTLTDRTEESNKKLADTSVLVDKWRELKNAIDVNKGSTEELTSAKEELLNIEQQLIVVSDGIITQFDIENGLIVEKIELLRTQIEAEQELSELHLRKTIATTDIDSLKKETEAIKESFETKKESYQQQIEAVSRLIQLETEYKQAWDAADIRERAKLRHDYIEAVKKEAEAVGLLGISYNNENNLISQAQSLLDKKAEELNKLNSDYAAGLHSINEYNAAVEYLTGSSEELGNALEDNNGSILDADNALKNLSSTTENLTEKTKTAVDILHEYNEAQSDLSELLRDSEKEISNLNSAYNTLANANELSTGQLLEMIALYPELAKYISQTGDVTLQNGEIVKAVAEAKKEAVKVELKAEAERLSGLLQAAQASIEISRQEFAEKARHARDYYSGMAVSAAARALQEELEAYKQLESSLASVQASLAVVNSISVDITPKSISSGRSSGNSTATTSRNSTASGSNDEERARQQAEKDAETARKNSLNAWEAYYKERDDNHKKWIDREKFYGRLSYEEEIKAYNEAIEYLTEASNVIDNLTYASEEEKTKIRNDIDSKIDSYERQRYSIEQKMYSEQQKNTIDAFNSHYKERLAISKNWIDEQKFYNNLSYEEEVEACERILAYLRDFYKEVDSLDISDDDKSGLKKDIDNEIKNFTRQQHTAENNLYAERLKTWQDGWKTWEDGEKNRLDRQKFYNELSIEEEIAHYDNMISVLKKAIEEAENLTYLSVEEKEKIIKEFADKIESYERQQYTAENNLQAEKVKAWQGGWTIWEEGEKSRLDKQKFYNELSLEEEIAHYDNMIVVLKEAIEEAEALTYLSAEERQGIIKNFLDKIEGYERQGYTARKKLKEQELQDAEDVQSKRDKELQRELDRAETLQEKLAIYAAQRIEAEKKLTETLSAINEKYWLSEHERLNEISAAYEIYTDTITNIDKKMHDTRRQLAEKSAQERKQIAIKAAEEWYDREKKLLESSYNTNKRALEKQLEQVREYYSRLDAEERRADRNKELGELYAEASIYRNAATKEGQDKYKSILSQIERLQKEADRESRQDAQKQQEAMISEQIKSLDESYKGQQDALKQRYEQMKESADKLVKSTANDLEAAADQVTDGLTTIFNAYDKQFDLFKGDTLKKVKNFVKEIAAALKNIDFRFGSSSDLVGAANNITNNNRTNSVIFNDYGNKNFNSKADLSDTWTELSSLILYSLAGKIR